jgi:hypothetical protein
MALLGDLATIRFQFVPLSSDRGLVLLQVALQSSQLSARLRIGFDQLAGATRHFGLHLRQLALLLGRLFGRLAGGLGQLIFLASAECA